MHAHPEDVSFSAGTTIFTVMLLGSPSPKSHKCSEGLFPHDASMTYLEKDK